jgi:hypothetical protein
MIEQVLGGWGAWMQAKNGHWEALHTFRGDKLGPHGWLVFSTRALAEAALTR